MYYTQIQLSEPNVNALHFLKAKEHNTREIKRQDKTGNE